MGRGTSDISKQAEEISIILQKYNGIPSQTVDKAAYSKVKYFLKAHPDDPNINTLIERYKLNEKKKRQLSQPVFEKKLSDITSILEKYQSFPTHNIKDYQTVYSFYNSYKDRPEVRRLIFLYPYPDSYAMVPYGKVQTVVLRKKVFIANKESAYNYILYVYQQYHELPKENSQPIKILKNVIRYIESGFETNYPALEPFLSEIVSLGCDNDMIKKGYGMVQFMRKSNQKKVHQELINNGACSIKYLSEFIVPGIKVSETFIFNYYSKRYKIIKILGSFPKHPEDFGKTVLYVHFTEYDLCDIDSIRNNTIMHYRDWKAYPPITVEDWKYWGCCNFFIDYKQHLDDGGDMIEFLKHSKSVPQHAFENSIPYFDDSKFGYFDYIFFLDEKGFKLEKNNFTNFIKITFDYNWKTEYRINEIQKLKDIFAKNGIL